MRVLVLGATLGSGCRPCGEGGACSVGEGRYFAVAPGGAEVGSRLPVLVHVHAWNSDPQRWLNDDAFLEAFTGAGLLVVLPEGRGESWNVSRREGERDDVAFIDEVLADVATRWSIDPDRVYVSGHSVGGAVVHRLACERSTVFRAFGPLSGAFWEPMPAGGDCRPEGVDVLHLHGSADTTWPMEGRSFGDEGGQAPVEATITFWQDHDACTESDATTSPRSGMTCDRRVCAEGTVEYCVHPGGHAAPDRWFDEHLAFYRERGLE